MKKFLLSIICALLPIIASAQNSYWDELQSTIEYGTDVLSQARASGNVDQWMLEELEMFLNQGQEMYKEQTASEEDVRAMIEDLSWRIHEVEEAMRGGGGEEPYAVLSDNNTVLTFYYDDQKAARGGMDVGPFAGHKERGWDQGDPNGNVEGIERVVFDESFANCTTITSTSSWFHGFKDLTTIIDLNNLKTDNVEDMSDMFWNCSSLTTLDVSGFNTTNVTNMWLMFLGCSSLTSLDLSNFNTSNVIGMYSMFSACSSLTSLDLSNFNTSNVTNMGYMFDGCSSLTSLDVSGFNTSNVNYLERSFSGCSSLTSLDVSGFNTENVTNMSSMFEGCSNLTSLDVRRFNTSKVTDMLGIFYNCSSLTNLDVSGFNTENVTNMKFMFDGCSSLTSLDVSRFNTSKVTDMVGMFYNCSGLTILDVSGFNTENVTNMEGMFSGCPGLKSLDVSGFNTSNVTNMSAMFAGCSSLTSLDVSGFNTSNVTDMLGMFWTCSSLTSLDVSGFNTSKVTDMTNMFSGSSNLTTIYVGEGWSTDSISPVNAGSSIFSGCTSLVGGAGTKYDQNHVDYTYAHIDGGTSNPGYLTDINGGGEAYFNDYTAYVYGNATLDDAFAEVGRETAIQTIAAIVWEGNDALTADMLSGIDNPNLLVFVNEASKAPVGVQNVVVNGVAEEIILTDASGNNNFYCPQSFRARSISYSRDFSQTTEIEECRGWETIALPFDVQSITHETHGALVPFGGENDGYPFWLRQLSDNGLARATQIEANKPYLISMPNSIIYPAEYNQNGTVTFSSSNVTVPETSAQSDSYAGVTLTAAFQQVAQGNNIYALNVGEARGEYPEGSVFEQNYRDIRPFQAYTTHTAGTRGFISLESLGGGNDDTTGIENFRIKNSELRDSDGFWYSLDGRRLNAKPTKKGVYVKDGRKIVIK